MRSPAPLTARFTLLGLMLFALATGCSKPRLGGAGEQSSSARPQGSRGSSGDSIDPSRCIQEYLIGGTRTCARLRDGNYRCRGRNEFLESTHGNWPNIPQARFESGFPGPWDKLQIEDGKTCGLRAGRLYCWGDNARAEFRPFDEGTSRPFKLGEPTLVYGFPPDITHFAVRGFHLCALNKTGKITCRIASLETITFDNVPAGVEQIVAGSDTFCVRTKQEVWCFGAQPYAFEGGDPTFSEDVFNPGPRRLVKIEGLQGRLVHLGMAGDSGCVLNEAGEVWCWGPTPFGQWGDGTVASCENGCPGLNHRAGHRAKVPPARELAVAGPQICTLSKSGEVWCWGASNYFPDVQLKNPQTIPAKVGLLGNDNVHVYGGDGHWCVEKPDQRLLCWGENDFGQISSGPCRPGMMDARSCPLLEVKFDRECE
ncbi:MAG TPA: hypothetical protein VFU02_16340 [Polyangiaceae bacterium]|nr:hypothetical protein [Polyangiaceae bacterium]